MNLPLPAAVFCCCTLLSPTLIPAPQARSVDEIIERHIEAIGGARAIKAIRTLRYERVYAHLEAGALYHHVICQQRPGRSRNERLGADYCVIVDGTRRWSRVIDPASGSATWEEDEYLRGVSNNFEERLGPFIRHREKRIGLEYAGTESIDGRTMHHLNTIISVEVNIPLDDSLFQPGASTPFPPRGASRNPEITNSIGMRLRLIPAGSFMMGSDTPRAEKDEKPIHKVILPEPFSLGLHEVTQAQYERVMGSNPSSFRRADHPVEMVSWKDAEAFCQKLSEITGQRCRLPTEAEWEYAARAGTSSAYYWGETADLRFAVYDSSGTAPVGSRLPNPWGLHDMSGNVWEWCSDRYRASWMEPAGPGPFPRWLQGRDGG